MKIHNFASFLCVTLLAGCANTVIIGHKHGVNLETEISADMTAPVNLNFGYESRSVAAVPPKKALPLPALFNPANVHDGELLSTYSVFRIQRDVMVQTGAAGEVTSTTEPGAFTIRTGVATGGAAVNIAGQQKVTSANKVNRVRPFGAAPSAFRSTGSASSTFQSMNGILTD